MLMHCVVMVSVSVIYKPPLSSVSLKVTSVLPAFAFFPAKNTIMRPFAGSTVSGKAHISGFSALFERYIPPRETSLFPGL